MLRRPLELLFEQLPKFAELRDGAFGRNTKAGIDALLAYDPATRRERVLAGVIRHRLINRAMFYAHSALPRQARRFAAFVPIVGPAAVAMRDKSTPLIIATGHFGPLFFAVAVLERRLRGRRVIVVLREGALYLGDVLPLLDALGFEYVVESHACMRGLVRALRENPRTVVVFAFDNPSPGPRQLHLPFLASTVAASTAIARLADLGGARIVTSFWLWRGVVPRLLFERSLEVQRGLGVGERRKYIVDELYRLLESYVRTSPEQWSGWDYVTAGAVTGFDVAATAARR